MGSFDNSSGETPSGSAGRVRQWGESTLLSRSESCVGAFCLQVAKLTLPSASLHSAQDDDVGPITKMAATFALAERATLEACLASWQPGADDGDIDQQDDGC